MWRKLRGKNVVMEWRSWTGVFTFVRRHWTGLFQSCWFELRTMDGHTVFVHSMLIDVIREATLLDYTAESGVTLYTLAGMTIDNHGTPSPPDEDGGDRTEVSNGST